MARRERSPAEPPPRRRLHLLSLGSDPVSRANELCLPGGAPGVPHRARHTPPAAPPIHSSIPLDPIHACRRAGRNGGFCCARGGGCLPPPAHPPPEPTTHGRCWARRFPRGHTSEAMACPRQWPRALALLLAAATTSQAVALAPSRPPAAAAAPAGASLTFLSVRNLGAALYGVGQGEEMRLGKNLPNYVAPTRCPGPKS